MKKVFTIFVGFVHDFAAGCWAATLFAVWWLYRADDQGLQPLLAGLKREFFYIGLVCVGIVLLAGAGRTFTYVGNVYGPEAERTRRKMLIVKHIALLIVFGLGTWWQYTMAF